MFRVYYWKYDWREGEVDFVVKIGKYTIPFEVNNKIHLWPKALVRYQELYLPDIILKISHDVPQYYSSEAPLKFPLYFVWRMPEFIISRTLYFPLTMSSTGSLMTNGSDEVSR